MELHELLNSLEGDSGSGSFSKTASDNTDDLSRAIDRALGSSEMTKTASFEGSPSGDLMKIAGSLAQAESDALVKEANVYGAAVADGFMSRMAAFDKTASVTGASEEALIKQAYHQGYQDTSMALQSGAGLSGTASSFEKEAAFEQGFNDTVKQAAFEQGYGDTIKEAAFEEGFKDTFKQAAFEQGFYDTVTEAQEFTKIASAVEDYGFRYGNSVLNQL